MQMRNQHEVETLRDQGALFVVNHSGGKDSQAMSILIHRLVPEEQIITIHADLHGVEWDGCWKHVLDTTPGTCFKVASHKTFWDLTKPRQKGKYIGQRFWPSPSTRQCTSDLKRDPIAKKVRHFLETMPGQAFGSSPIVVNAMGIRALESVGRAKGLDSKDFDAQVKAYVEARPKGMNKDDAKKAGKAKAKPITLKTNKRESVNGRQYYQWYPIFDMTIDEVWSTIESAGQKPHSIYSTGMGRLSCCFCIMASDSDLRLAALMMPDLYKQYCDMEKELDMAMVMPKEIKGKKVRRFLPEVTGIDPENNPGPDGITDEDRKVESYDDGACGGWDASQDDAQVVEPINREADRAPAQDSGDIQDGLTVLSYGAGQDSTALLYKYINDAGFRARFIQGKFLVLMSDTGNEHPETYIHVTRTRELCAQHGIEFHLITADQGYHGSNWQSLQGKWAVADTIGSKAYRFRMSCTFQLKMYPIYKYLEDYLAEHAGVESKNKKGYYQYVAKTGRKVRVILGIAGDEGTRIAKHQAPEKWRRENVEYSYPLIDMDMNRAACQAYIKSVGGIVPLPSNCMYCPFLSEVELLWLNNHYPDAFQEWVRLEKRKLDRFEDMGAKNLGVWGKYEYNLDQVLADAKEKYKHWTREQIDTYKMSHGHCVMSKY